MSARSSTRCEQWRACEPAAAVRRGAASSKPAAMAARLERTLSQVRRSARRPGGGPGGGARSRNSTGNRLDAGAAHQAAKRASEQAKPAS